MDAKTPIVPAATIMVFSRVVKSRLVAPGMMSMASTNSRPTAFIATTTVAFKSAVKMYSTSRNGIPRVWASSGSKLHTWSQRKSATATTDDGPRREDEDTPEPQPT